MVQAVSAVPATPAPSVAETAWSAPAPIVADRLVTPLPAPPDGSTVVPLIGYQAVDPATVLTSYLAETPAVRDTGIAAEAGFLGAVPPEGTTALAVADVVVGVIGDTRCIPQQVVVVDAPDSVRIGVAFAPLSTGVAAGTPVEACIPVAPVTAPAAAPIPGPDGSTPDPNGVADASTRTTYLIPVDLPAPLGGRALLDLGGQPVPAVPAPAGL